MLVLVRRFSFRPYSLGRLSRRREFCTAPREITKSEEQEKYVSIYEQETGTVHVNKIPTVKGFDILRNPKLNKVSKYLAR